MCFVIWDSQVFRIAFAQPVQGLRQDDAPFCSYWAITNQANKLLLSCSLHMWRHCHESLCLLNYHMILSLYYGYQVVYEAWSGSGAKVVLTYEIIQTRNDVEPFQNALAPGINFWWVDGEVRDLGWLRIFEKFGLKATYWETIETDYLISINQSTTALS